MGSHLDVQNKDPSGREQCHDKQNSSDLAHHEGKALSLVSLVTRRFGLEAWRVLKEEYEGKGGNRTAALLRCILNPRRRWEKMQSEGRDLGDTTELPQVQTSSRRSKWRL